MQNHPLTPADAALLSGYGLAPADYPSAIRRTYGQNEYLSREGEPLRHLYILTSGKLKVLMNLSDGKQLLLAYFMSRGIIGDIELMCDVRANQATLQAVTPLSCIAIPLKEYREKLRANLAFINHIGKELAEKLQQRAINGAITTLQPLETRLCAYILQTEIENRFEETLTEVAAMVGGSYRHLLRCLEKLCADGVLQKQEKSYRIANRQLLQAKSGDLYMLH